MNVFTGSITHSAPALMTKIEARRQMRDLVAITNLLVIADLYKFNSDTKC